MSMSDEFRTKTFTTKQSENDLLTDKNTFSLLQGALIFLEQSVHDTVKYFRRKEESYSPVIGT